MTDCCLGIFAKWPLPGAVKTRLGGSPEWAAAVARAFLLDTLSRTSGLGRRVLVFSPEGALEDFTWLVSGIELVPQASGDLGARLESFITTALATASKAVVIGTDS